MVEEDQEETQEEGKINMNLTREPREVKRALKAKEEKRPTQSKINWVAGVMALAAVLSDPTFGEAFIPPQVLPKVMLGCSALVFVLRTFFSGAKVKWERPEWRRQRQR